MKLLRPKEIWILLKETAIEWYNDDVFRLSAALSYYTVFSIAPLLIVVLFFVGLFWGDQTAGVQARLLDQISGLTGPEGADLVGTMLENIDRPGSGGLLATILGVGALVFGATVVFAQLQNALNTIWEVQPSGAGLKSYLLTRALSFGLILGVGFLLLVSLIISVVLSAVDDFITGLAPELYLLIRAVNFLVSFSVITLLFAMIYRYLPDTVIAWRDVLVGAAITTLLFILGKFGIGLYLGNSGVQSTYGAAGSLAVLLLWIYYSAMIFFFGAEFTQVYARRHGTRIAPDEEAKRIGEARKPEQAQTKEPSYGPRDAQPLVLAQTSPTPSRAKRYGALFLAFLIGRFFGRRRS